MRLLHYVFGKDVSTPFYLTERLSWVQAVASVATHKNGKIKNIQSIIDKYISEWEGRGN